ncbi:HipA domain-containing protein [Rhizobium sp. AN95]|nr:HipA domain-containing protein [Rhizobium sp. AN95]
MAPLYDLMCAAVYHQVDQSLPQGISGRFHVPDLRRADWQALADDIGLSGASTLKRVEELAKLVSVACDEVARYIVALSSDPTRILERITHSVQKRCRRIQETMRDR